MNHMKKRCKGVTACKLSKYLWKKKKRNKQNTNNTNTFSSSNLVFSGLQSRYL